MNRSSDTVEAPKSGRPGRLRLRNTATKPQLLVTSLDSGVDADKAKTLVDDASVPAINNQGHCAPHERKPTAKATTTKRRKLAPQDAGTTAASSDIPLSLVSQFSVTVPH